MPMHIEEMTSEVAVFDGELPLSPAQMDQIVCKVIECLEEKKLQEQQNRDATGLRREVTPKLNIGE